MRMTYKEIVRNSYQIYRKNGLIAYILFFFLALLASSFILLTVFLPILLWLVIPFIVIPILFSAQLAITLLREQNFFTFRGFLNCFVSYFKEKFRSTFAVIKNGLVTFGFSLLFAMIFAIIINLCFYYTNYLNYATILNQITLLVDDYDALIEYIKSQQVFFNYILIWNDLPISGFAYFLFVFLCSRSSISLFERMGSLTLTSGKLSTIIHNGVIRNNQKAFNRYYLELMWPFFLILLGSFALGSYIGYLVVSYNYPISIIGLSFSVLVTYGVFGPFYLSNKEAIYLALDNEYKVELDKFSKKIVQSLDQIMDELKKAKEEQEKDSDSASE